VTHYVVSVPIWITNIARTERTPFLKKKLIKWTALRNWMTYAEQIRPGHMYKKIHSVRLVRYTEKYFLFWKTFTFILHGVHPVVCHDITDGVVCTTIISTNVNRQIDTTVSPSVYCAKVLRSKQSCKAKNAATTTTGIPSHTHTYKHQTLCLQEQN
jgi:hypothetical protein